MTLEQAWNTLFNAALIWLAVLIALMLIRAIIGPRVTDRLLSINMIGTMVICCITILSVMLHESYLVDVALIYAMISFVAVLILAMVYIPSNRSTKIRSFTVRKKEGGGTDGRIAPRRLMEERDESREAQESPEDKERQESPGNADRSKEPDGEDGRS